MSDSQAGHVFAVAAGLGLRVIAAHAPLRFHCDGTSLDIACRHPSGWRSARVTPDRGKFVFQLHEHTPALSDVCAVETGPSWDAWWVETSLYRIPLPAAWTVHSAGDRKDHAMFDLLGPAGASIFIRVPRRMPSLESLLGPGQQFRDTGQLPRAAWIEFDYTHDGQAWRQRHELLHRGLMPIVVTLLSPAQAVEACTPTLASIVEQVVATPDDRAGAGT